MDIGVLRNVNLNKLPILWELLRCRSVSLAAANLNMTQSTASTALRHLRDFFEDELLVPSGREMLLTERAQEILPLLEITLKMLEDIVREPHFEPENADGVFRIATADYVSTLILPAMADKLRSDAPRLTVQMTTPNARIVHDLKMGLVDIAIGPEQFLDWIGVRGEEGSFYVEPCFSDPLVCIESLHEAETHMEIDSYLKRPHATIHLARDMTANIETDTLISNGLKQYDRIIVPNFTLIPLIIEKSNMISLIPRSLAEYYKKHYDIRIFDPPLNYPAVNLNIFWIKGREKDMKFKWFLDSIKSCFAIRSMRESG